MCYTYTVEQNLREVRTVSYFACSIYGSMQSNITPKSERPQHTDVNIIQPGCSGLSEEINEWRYQQNKRTCHLTKQLRSHNAERDHTDDKCLRVPKSVVSGVG